MHPRRQLQIGPLEEAQIAVNTFEAVPEGCAAAFRGVDNGHTSSAEPCVRNTERIVDTRTRDDDVQAGEAERYDIADHVVLAPATGLASGNPKATIQKGRARTHRPVRRVERHGGSARGPEHSSVHQGV